MTQIKPPRSIAFYVRVSTTSQDYPSQLHAMREFCRRQGWRPPATPKIFAEKISGKLAKRTKLDLLLQECRNGTVDCVILYAIDRMGNSFVHLVNIQAELDRLKIRVIGVVDGVDTAANSAAANHWRNTMNTAAQFNRERISERTRAGLSAAAAAGRLGGRPRTKDAAIRKAFSLQGKKSQKEIARITKLSEGYISQLFSGDRAKPKT